MGFENNVNKLFIKLVFFVFIEFNVEILKIIEGFENCKMKMAFRRHFEISI